MDFNTLTLAQLRELAKSKDVKGVTGLKKSQLIEELERLSVAEEQLIKTEKAEQTRKPEQTKKPEQTRKSEQARKPEQAKKAEQARKPEQMKKTEKTERVTDNSRPPIRKDGARENKPNTQARNSSDNRSVRVTPTEQNPIHISERMGENQSSLRSADNASLQTAGNTSRQMTTGNESQQNLEQQTSNTIAEPKTYNAREQRPKENVTEEKKINIRNEAFTKEEFEQLNNPEINALNSNIEVYGILETVEGYGFVRSANYLPGENDIYISPIQIRRFHLKTGDVLKGMKRVKTSAEKFGALLYIESVNGFHPLEAGKRRPFEELIPIFPEEKIQLEQPGSGIPMRIIDIISPIGKGQRGMIVSPPKAGKTTLLKQIAKTISLNYPDIHMLVLLIDERPEEVTDIRESIEGPNVEVIYSTFDELPEHHKRVSEMVLERAKRLVEHKKDVVILLDSITRLARAYNMIVQPSGRTLTGGLDPAALHSPKKFFGAARNIRGGGSLTILATALVETGSKMDDVVFEEFKGTGNMELVLDRKLSEKRIFPAIDIAKSSTRREDLLLSKEEQDVMYLIRREFSGSKSDEAIEEVLRLFTKTRDNKEFVQLVQKSLGHR